MKRPRRTPPSLRQGNSRFTKNRVASRGEGGDEDGGVGETATSIARGAGPKSALSAGSVAHYSRRWKDGEEEKRREKERERETVTRDDEERTADGEERPWHRTTSLNPKECRKRKQKDRASSCEREYFSPLPLAPPSFFLACKTYCVGDFLPSMRF